MNYKIQAIFATESEANSASSLLHAAGYRKEFLGYTQNAHLQPESLVEDHHIDKNYVTVLTTNLNRAFKAPWVIETLSKNSFHNFSRPFQQFCWEGFLSLRANRSNLIFFRSIKFLDLFKEQSSFPLQSFLRRLRRRKKGFSFQNYEVV